MVEIVWTEPSLDHHDSIAVYLARGSSVDPDQFIRALMDSTLKLADFPRLGSVVAEVDRDDVREIIHDGYRVVYHLRDQQLAVIAVVHSARLLDLDELLADLGI